MYKIAVTALLGLNLLASVIIENPAEQKYVDKSFFAQESPMGDWSSGGGNAVVCFKDTKKDEAFELIKNTEGGYLPNAIFEKDMISSIEMYDLFEAKLPRGIEATIPEIIKIKKSQSFNDYFTLTFNRMWGTVPSVSDTFAQGRWLIKDSDIRFYNGGLKQQNDIGEVTFIDEERCVIQTMAVQRNLGDAFELIVDSRLFNHINHSRQSKATLLIHEYIYAYSRRKLGHKLSLPTRKLVGSIVSYHDSLTVNNVSGMAYHLGYTYLSKVEDIENDKVFEASFIAHSLEFFINQIENFDYEMLFTLEEHTRMTIGDSEYRDLINFLIENNVITSFAEYRTDQIHIMISGIANDKVKRLALEYFNAFNLKKKIVISDFWNRRLEELKEHLYSFELFGEADKNALFEFYQYEVESLILSSIDWVSFGDSKNPYGTGLDTAAQYMSTRGASELTSILKHSLERKTFKNIFDPFDIIIPKP